MKIPFWFVYGEADKRQALIINAEDRTEANKLFATLGKGNPSFTSVAVVCERCKEYRPIYGYTGKYLASGLCKSTDAKPCKKI